MENARKGSSETLNDHYLCPLPEKNLAGVRTSDKFLATPRYLLFGLKLLCVKIVIGIDEVKTLTDSNSINSHPLPLTSIHNHVWPGL